MHIHKTIIIVMNAFGKYIKKIIYQILFDNIIKFLLKIKISNQ